LNWKKISVSTEKKFQLVYNWNFFSVLMDISKNQWRSTGGERNIVDFTGYPSNHFSGCRQNGRKCFLILWWRKIIGKTICFILLNFYDRNSSNGISSSDDSKIIFQPKRNGILEMIQSKKRWFYNLSDFEFFGSIL
jgi:hypothetical protein